MDGESVTLNLEENPHVPSDTPVYVSENGVIRRWEDTDSMVRVTYFYTYSIFIVMDVIDFFFKSKKLFFQRNRAYFVSFYMGIFINFSHAEI